jgi:hypothetical protein
VTSHVTSSQFARQRFTDSTVTGPQCHNVVRSNVTAHLLARVTYDSQSAVYHVVLSAVNHVVQSAVHHLVPSDEHHLVPSTVYHLVLSAVSHLVLSAVHHLVPSPHKPPGPISWQTTWSHRLTHHLVLSSVNHVVSSAVHQLVPSVDTPRSSINTDGLQSDQLIRSTSDQLLLSNGAHTFGNATRKPGQFQQRWWQL